MIPVLARFRLRVGDGRRFGPWIVPLPLVYLLLAPVLILALPVLIVACLVASVNPIRALAAAWRVLAAAAGTAVEVETREVSILFHIR
jgi:hypothetical protein